MRGKQGESELLISKTTSGKFRLFSNVCWKMKKILQNVITQVECNKTVIKPGLFHLLYQNSFCYPYIKICLSHISHRHVLLMHQSIKPVTDSKPMLLPVQQVKFQSKQKNKYHQPLKAYLTSDAGVEFVSQDCNDNKAI